MNYTSVELSKLVEGGEHDARGPGMTSPAAIKKDTAELVASIKAHGLLQPLLVRRIPDTFKYRVVAGNRRLRALRLIHGKKDVEVPVVVTDLSDEAAYEHSLAENVIRKQMHPVDEFDAFAKLVAQGWAPEQVATRFGVAEKHVRQRMQLARLSPNLRAAWRLGTISADQAAALSSVDRHELQERIWKERSKQGEWSTRPDQLRAALRAANKGIEADDPIVEFIGGLDAYLARGGLIDEDLFSAQKTLTSPGVIDGMEREVLEAACERFRAEGWAFAEINDVNVWDVKCIDLMPWYAPAEQKMIKADPTYSPNYAADDAANERAEADPEARKISGVYVSRAGAEIDAITLVAPKGAVTTRLAAQDANGPGDGEPGAQDGDREGEGGDETGGGEVAAPDGAKVNWALREAMSERLTLALSSALAGDPHAATAALAASLRYALYAYGGGSPLRIDARDAWRGLNEEREHAGAEVWVEHFTAYANMSAERLATEIASFAPRLIDVRAPRFDPRGEAYTRGRGDLVEALAAQLSLSSLTGSIDSYFDRLAYFERLTKDELNAVLTEMGVEGTRPAKKAALVEVAVERAKATGWLPPDLRLPGLIALRVKDDANA